MLDRLELKGFKLIAMTGVGQTCIWTMHKEASTSEDGLDNSCDAKISCNSPLIDTELKSKEV